MAGEIPTGGAIASLGRQVHRAAVRVRGERELRYVPADPEHEDRKLAGQPAEAYAGTETYGIDENGNFLGTEQDWARLEAQYAWIEEFFVNHVGPDPADFDPTIEAMRRVELALHDKDADVSPVDDPHARAERSLGNWWGGAASTFYNDFFVPIPNVVRHQAVIARTLHLAMIANRDIFAEARKDLKKIGDAAVESIEAVGRGGGSGDLSLLLGVVAAVTTLAASAATMGAAAPAVVNAWTLVAGISSAGSLAAAEFAPPKERELTAGSVDEVLARMVDMVLEDVEDIDQSEREIVRVLRDDLDVLTADVESFLPRQPNRPAPSGGFQPPA
ncbi:hypothetical protein GCM10022225_47920 [Plantactinospora mayteni]|uniref:Uncharacterized protein n=1 Tax=Plantactinospora mayteni TaxID=566021 RepID=A0ABQ4ESP9_9ACTN|nr:hypothetical protein [Plantactinospora mayteni]GIG97697.1 hypothetical protein Pma05_42700 [Plantactinospora mayteni]